MAFTDQGRAPVRTPGRAHAHEREGGAMAECEDLMVRAAAWLQTSGKGVQLWSVLQNVTRPHDRAQRADSHGRGLDAAARVEAQAGKKVGAERRGVRANVCGGA